MRTILEDVTVGQAQKVSNCRVDQWGLRSSITSLVILSFFIHTSQGSFADFSIYPRAVKPSLSL